MIDNDELRKRAEKIFREKAVLLPENLAAMSPEEARQALHELLVHQIELEIQNEELRRAQVELDAARTRYFDFYDLAPVGYVTLSEKGLILEANLTTATLLGTARGALVKQPFSRFILKEDQDIFYLHRKQLFEIREPQSRPWELARAAYDLRLVKLDGTVFWARLETIAAQDATGAPVCRVVLSDISERKRAEELSCAQRDLAQTLSATTSLDAALRLCLAAAISVAGMDAGGIYLVDVTSGDLDLIVDDGLSPAFVASIAHYLADSASAQLVQAGQPIYAQHQKLGVSLDDVRRREGLHASAVIPVLHERQVIACLNLASHTLDEVPVFARHALEIIAAQIGGSIVRLRAGQALRESEERYQRITETITDYIYTVRVADGRAAETTHGPGCLAVTGYRANEFAKDHFLWFHMVAVEDRPKVEDQARRILAGEDPPPIEHRIVHKNGTIRWVRNTFVPHRDEHGVLVAYDGLVQDITERKLAEDALRESQKRFQALTETTSDFVWEIDANGVYTYCSPQINELWGYKPEDMIGRTPFDLMPPEDREQAIKMFRIISESSSSFKGMEINSYDNTGRIVVLETSGAPFFDIDGRLCGYRGISRDITVRKRAEEEKAKLEAQLRQAQKMESIGRLAGGVAHDFNNMLSVILGYTELGLKQVDPAQPLHADLTEIRKAAERAADLTRQLLAFARKQIVTPRVLDLNKAVAGMLKMLQRIIGEDIRLNWQPEADLWPIKVDPSQIDQILANLCVNARDAIADIGKLTIATGNNILDADYCADHPDFAAGEYVRLDVSDDGCGMDHETLDKLFEPFFTTKELGKGTGLGLATVYGIVKQNNGFIDVHSDPGSGTKFTIYLPRYVGKAEQAARTEGAAKPDMRGRETILLVEDEPAVLSLTTLMLEKQGYTVLAASTPGEAIRLARERAGEIHLLMTDVVMPEMNGRDLAKNLLALYPGLKCLFMSGYTADLIAHHGVLDEGVNFIQKPIFIKDLAAKVREALEE